MQNRQIAYFFLDIFLSIAFFVMQNKEEKIYKKALIV